MFTAISDLFPGHQRSSTNSNPYEEILEKKLEDIPAAEEDSEWETDVTEDEVSKPATPKLEDALAKLDNLDLDSDDDMRYQRLSKVAASQQEDIAAPAEPTVTISESQAVSNGFHRDEEEEEVEVAEEALPTSTLISGIMDIDDLLMKGSHFVALDSSPVFFNDEEDSTPKTLSGDFTNAKPIADIVQVRQQSVLAPGEHLCLPHLLLVFTTTTI